MLHLINSVIFFCLLKNPYFEKIDTGYLMHLKKNIKFCLLPELLYIRHEKNIKIYFFVEYWFAFAYKRYFMRFMLNKGLEQKMPRQKVNRKNMTLLWMKK